MSDRDALVLTPEHVLVRLVPAGLGSRFLALVADFAIIAGLSAFLTLALHAALPGAVARLLSATLGFVLTWGYHVFFEVRRQGQTPGKSMASIRVVDGRGLPLTASQSFVRNVVRALDFLPFGYGVGAAAAFLDRHHRRLGDLAADTFVIQERPVGERVLDLPRSPRFNSLATPRTRRLVRHRIGLEDRELLLALCLRAERLEPGARFDLMELVGAHYREKLEVDDPHLSGENLLRDLAALVLSAEAAA